MKFDIISFDLQGTLSDAAFSDEFWLETLPKLNAKYKRISLKKSKELLKNEFKKYGKYDSRYYSVKYWMKELEQNLSFEDLQKKMRNKPVFFDDTLGLIKTLQKKAKLIIISSTTRDFIDVELGEHKTYFDEVYSSLDDFNIAGKPKEIYLKIANIMKTNPARILHIGDNYEMDIENANEAGFKTFYFDRSKPRTRLIEDLKKRINDRRAYST